MKTPCSAILLGALVTTLAWAEPVQSKRLRALDFSPFRRELAGLQVEEMARVQRLLQGATIPQLQARMASGALTSEQLTLFCLGRMRDQDEHFRGYIEVNPEALEEARASDRLRASGQLLGPLHGIPLNLKDNINTAAPLHTSGGAEILLNYSPAQDAPIVTRVRKAGAVVLGKASLSELAGAVTTKPPGSNAVSGAGVNPYREGLPVLGSSSGSAITTSAYLTVLSVGTETSGSLISPATAIGVVGMKPSLGLVSGEGVIPLISFQDSPGPVARSVTDAAILLDALDQVSVDYLAGLRPEALRGVRAGLLPEVRQPGLRHDRILKGLASCQAVTREIDQPLAGLSILECLILALGYDTVPYLASCGCPVQSAADLQRYNAARPGRRIPFGQDFVDICAQVSESALNAAEVKPEEATGYYQKLCLDNRALAASKLDQMFDQQGVEVLVSHFNLASEYYATAGYPAITVPLGLDEKGAPIGVTFIARRGQDAALLAYAYAFEQATRLRVEPPLGFRG